MTVRVYKSTDTSAPTLQGVVGGAYSSGWADGSLLNLLDKCLVAGYGSKTAAGWSSRTSGLTSGYGGTSKGMFKQGGGSGMYYRVLDDGSLTGGAREAGIIGYENADDVDTAHSGAGLFPTNAQLSTGVVMRKSNSADSTQNNWILVADNKTVMLFVDSVGLSTRYYAAMYLGDIKSLYTGDAYNAVAIARATSASTDTATNEKLDLYNAGSSRNSFNAITGHYIARQYAQTGAAQTIAKIGGMFADTTSGGVAFAGNTGHVYPNAPDMKTLVSRTYIVETGQYVRGWCRGLWTPEARIPLGETIAGSGDLAGRTFTCLGLPTGNSTTNGRWLIETSDTWD